MPLKDKSSVSSRSKMVAMFFKYIVSVQRLKQVMVHYSHIIRKNALLAEDKRRKAKVQIWAFNCFSMPYTVFRWD